jgi:hypothetical protein
VNSLAQSVSVFTAVLSASCLIAFPLRAQSIKPTQREILAEKIKTTAYSYASDPSDYSLVQAVEKDAWKMIQMSEGFSSCSLPTYDLVQRMEGFNATYIQMKSMLDALPSNIPDQIRQQSVAQTESALNGQKASIGKVLQNVLKYCK